MATLTVTALYLVILLWVLWAYLRRRDPVLRDLIFIFTATAMAFVLSVIRLVTDTPDRLLTALPSAVLLGQPFFTLLLVGRLRPVPTWLTGAALVGWLATAVPVVLTDRTPVPAAVALPAAAVFVATDAVAAWLLAVTARRRGGAARVRLWFAAGGTALFGCSLAVAAAGPALTVGVRAMLVVSAAMYLLAFLPPRALTRAWSSGAAYAVMRSLIAAPADEPPHQVWQRYCGDARATLGADEVVVVQPDAAGVIRLVSRPGLEVGGGHYDDGDVERLLSVPGDWHGGGPTIDALTDATRPPRLAVDLAGSTGTRFVTAAPLSVAHRRGALVLLNRYRTLAADEDVTAFAELARQAAALAERATALAERQRAEAMFRGLLEAAPDGIIGVTRDGRITLMNAQAERLFGYRREELIGQSVEVLVPRRSHGTHPAQREHYFANPRTRSMGAGLPLAAVRKDGTEFPAEISLSALETDQGLIVSAAVRDVTERMQTQAERERLVAQAERDAAERRAQRTRRLESLGQLAGGVAHDFNNILGVITTYTELVRDTLETVQAPEPARRDLSAARDDLDQISWAAERAAQLTRQLLAFGRRDITQTEVLNVNHLISDVDRTLHRALGDPVQLLPQLDPALAPVVADPGHIEQILVNLAANARDAMPDGGTLSIETANVRLEHDDVADTVLTAGQYVRIRVSDTGTGMPQEVAERAFEPFYTTKPQGAGTGLGLATVYGVAIAAGGDVRLYTEPGIGTTVTILLPAAEPEPEAERGGDAEAVPPSPASDTGRPDETILLVEDEPALRDVAGRILGRAGYRVLPAAGGDEAIHLAETHSGPIHLLLTDVIMPGMMGNEVAARVQALRAGLPVLYMSGYAQPVLTEHGTLPPDVVIVQKPFTRRELLGHVRGILGRSEALPPQPRQ